MKKITIVWLFLLCGITFCTAKTSVWKVSKNGKILYLGGSVHSLRAEDYPLPDAFDIAFDNSDKIIFETDIEQIAKPEISYMIMQKSVLPDSMKLSDLLNEQVLKQLKVACDSFRLPFDDMQQFKPSILITFLTVAKMQQVGFSMDGVDNYYLQKAKSANKNIGFLESVEYQVDVLVDMGLGYEDEFVKYSLEDLEELENQIGLLLLEWKRGTSVTLNYQLSVMKTQFPTVYKSVMTNRNNNWMPKIINYMSEEETSFVIVGLAHMYGQDGLLQQLTDKGYTIEQMGISIQN